jgi:hypothetical protein
LFDYVLDLPQPPQPQPPLQLAIARLPFDPAWEVHALGDMNIQCPSCHALHWKAEALTSSTINNPLFGMCCYQGKISLPELHHIPQALYNFFTVNDPISKEFHSCVLFYNNSLAMTSTGKTTDYVINQGGGAPYSYVLRGELIHKAGSIIPLRNQDPIYSQLYIHDTEHAADYRLSRHTRLNRKYPLNRNILTLLQGILHESHPAITLYQQAYERTINMPPDQQFSVSLHFDPNSDR